MTVLTGTTLEEVGVDAVALKPPRWIYGAQPGCR